MRIVFSLSLLCAAFASVQCIGQEGSVIYAETEEEFKEAASKISLDRVNAQLRKEQQQAAVERMLDFFAENEIPADALGLVDEQVGIIEELKTEYEATVKELTQVNFDELTPEERFNTSRLNTRKLKRARDKYVQAVSETFIDHQIDVINSFDARKTGVPKVVTESGVGKILGLTQQQKERIRSRSDKIAMKIHDFVHEIRKESYDAVVGELSDEQVEDLKQLYGDRYIQEYFKSNDLLTMFEHHLYDGKLLPSHDQKLSSPKQALKSTDVWDRQR